MTLSDVHRTPPLFRSKVDRVGVEGVDFPLRVKTKDGREVNVDAVFNMFGSLVRERRGIDMSRFTEVLFQNFSRCITIFDFELLLRELKERLGALDVFVSASFKYFIFKSSPVTNLEQVLGIPCSFAGILGPRGYLFYEKVKVPVTSVCPCSKELCRERSVKDVFVGYGAHNQRGVITLQVRCQPGSVYLEDLIEICESSGSCEVYSLLKRPDEQYVTKHAYENPKFVEDIVREVAFKVSNIESVYWFKVKVENFESIHNHSATAYMCRERIANTDKWRVSKGEFL